MMSLALWALGAGGAILPFWPLITKLFRFGKLTAHLNRERVAHEAADEIWPATMQGALEQHTETTKRTAYKLLLAGTSVSTIVFGAQWYCNSQLRERHLQEVKVEQGKTLMAQHDATQRYNDYTDIKTKYDTLVNLQGAASAQREDVIKVKTTKKIEGAKRAAKLPPTNVVDAADWLRVESAGSGATPASAPPVPVS